VDLTRAAIDDVLTHGPLPDEVTVDPATGEVAVRRDNNSTPFTIRIETTPAFDPSPYPRVSTSIVESRDTGVIRVSEDASPDQVRRAVAASLAELATTVRERAADLRTDATTMLAEGSRETRLSPRDVPALPSSRSSRAISTRRSPAEMPDGSPH